MTVAARKTNTVSPQQYLTFERQAKTKSEYFGGIIVSMAGASWQHNLITSNIARLLGNQFVEGPCAVVSSDLRVPVPECDRYFYPDVVLVCQDPQFEDAEMDSLLNPTLIVEVFSSSSERLDREEKYDCYRTLPSLTEYVLVSQSHQRIEHFSRQSDGSWTHFVVTDPAESLVIPSIHCELNAEQVYSRVSFGESRKPIDRES